MGFQCDTHGTVQPKYGYVLNLHLDDGTDNIRAVLWRQQVLDLVGMKEDEFMKFKESPFEFEPKKTELLGHIVKAVGRVNKNETFNTTEFIIQQIDTNPDPEKEMKKLEAENPAAATAQAEPKKKDTTILGAGEEKPKPKPAEPKPEEELEVESEDLFSVEDI